MFVASTLTIANVVRYAKPNYIVITS